MPTNRRRRTRSPAPVAFDAIGRGEITRWALGTILIEGEYVRMRGSALPAWPSWEAWAETYSVCRSAFLAHQRERFPDKVPLSELLFAAFERGDDPGAVELPQEPDARLALK